MQEVIVIGDSEESSSTPDPRPLPQDDTRVCALIVKVLCMCPCIHVLSLEEFRAIRQTQDIEYQASLAAESAKVYCA